jgi:Flp pilus assembly protein TadB
MLLIGAFTLAVLSGLRTPFWMDVLFACGAAVLPYAYVLKRRAKRLDQFEKQFPDALDFLARSLRAGHPLPVCLELLAQEESPPLSVEMRKTAEERKLGMPLDQALGNLAKRVPLLNVRIFVAAVKLQSRTGGKLSEVLTSMSETMREATAVEGEVKALAAHGRVTGAVLTVLPVVIAILMTAVNPGDLNILFENPELRSVNNIPSCGMQIVTGRPQMISCLKKSRERGRVRRDHRVGACKAAEKMHAHLTGSGSRCSPGEGILAVKSEHRHGSASERRSLA